MRTSQLHALSLLAGTFLVGTAGYLTTAQDSHLRHHPVLSEQEKEILGHMSLLEVDQNPTLRIVGLNVQIVNGLGATNGNPGDPGTTTRSQTHVNGVGNLIVGYNEPGNPNGDDRSGSHNLVVGAGNSYSSFGGIVGPHHGSIHAPFATVTGGDRNVANTPFSSVSGGVANIAGTSFPPSPYGGYGPYTYSGASVSGGYQNLANGLYASVSGGRYNLASGDSSSVSGGSMRIATGANDWVGGSLLEED